MSMKTRFGLVSVCGMLFLLSSPPAAQQEQGKVLKSCPLLTNVEAAAVIGKDPIFDGVEATSGTTRISLLCEWVQGVRTLKVQLLKTMGGKAAWEAMRTLSNGTLEPGLGDYAYSGFDGTQAEVFIVKGPMQLEVTLSGKGATAADVPKVREAAKKAFARL